MKRNVFLFLILSLNYSISYSQKGFYASIHGGMDFDQWELQSASNTIKESAIISSSFGLEIGRQFNNYFSVETGIIRKYYYEGYAVEINDDFGNFGTSSNSITTIQIPLRIKARIFAKKEKFAFYGQLGYHLCFNTEFGTGGSGFSTVSSATDSITIWEVSNNNYAKVFGLLEAGIGMELFTNNKVGVSFGVNYFSGFKTTGTIDLTYQVNNGVIKTNQLLSSGDYFAWHVGIMVPFSAFKEKEELEIETEF